eukprot:8338-Heterococcus_DN1.PRE.3
MLACESLVELSCMSQDLEVELLELLLDACLRKQWRVLYNTYLTSIVLAKSCGTHCSCMHAVACSKSARTCWRCLKCTRAAPTDVHSAQRSVHATSALTLLLRQVSTALISVALSARSTGLLMPSSTDSACYVLQQRVH